MAKKRLVSMILWVSILVLAVGCNGNDYPDNPTSKPSANQTNPPKEPSYYKVVLEGGNVLEGREEMERFYETTQNKEPAHLTIIQRYMTDGVQTEYTKEISFDGEKYIYECEGRTSEYLYLNYSISDSYPEGSNIRKTFSYCLANEEDITAEAIWRSLLSSVRVEIIDGTVIYQEYDYRDLCFNSSELIMIRKDDRYYGANFSNRNTACRIVDGLNWVKFEDIDEGDERYSFNWSASNLMIEMRRTVVNDKNNLMKFKDEANVCHVTYYFDFENRVAVMHYPFISSMSGALIATLTDEDILKTEELFVLFQGQSGTNYGQYEYSNGSHTISFEINQDGSGKLFVKALGIVEELYSIYVHGDGFISLRTLSSNQNENVYVFTMRGENDGYTYVAGKSSPSDQFEAYLTDGMCFAWIGYEHPGQAAQS